jgi:hypothetical protein
MDNFPFIHDQKVPYMRMSIKLKGLWAELALRYFVM